MNDVSKIVADALAAGAIPWRLPTFPRLIISARHYWGVNPILLNIAAIKMNLTSPWWATELQWSFEASEVIVGPENGVYLPKEDQWVLNYDQTDRSYKPPSLPPVNVEAFFDALVENAKIKIQSSIDSACNYNRDKDVIRMPYQFMFVYGPGGIEGYWDALAHEIFHWSESRMGWLADDATNEMRAEIAARYLCGALQVKPLAMRFRAHHNKWVGSWVRAMRADPTLLFRVCNDVCHTIAWLMTLVGKDTPLQDTTTPAPKDRLIETDFKIAVAW